MSSLINYIYNSIYGEDKPAQIKRAYGWKRGSAYDNKEKHVFCLSRGHSNIKQVDLRSKCPSIYDQGHLGSCTANAIGFCYHFDELAQNEKSPFQPSRLFIYYNERDIEGHIDEDSGAEIHDGVSSICKVGVCSEDDWPYDINRFTEKPHKSCYESAREHHSIQYRAVSQSIDQLKAALIDGFPVVFGFLVYESFESPEVAQTGIMPIPKEGEQLLGGHAVALVGFDDDKQWFIVRNSWGEGWGDKGYFYMPYSFIQDPEMASDFWTITKTFDEETANVTTNTESRDIQNEEVKEKIEANLKFKILSEKLLQMSHNEEQVIVGKRHRRHNKHKVH